MKAPLVSVIVLSYDRPALLAKALDSVAAQTYANAEVIVVDNRSPRSEEVAALVGRYAGVRLIRNDANLGFTGGMNRGVEAATGVYFYCTNDDMTLAPDCVERLVEYAEAHASAGLLTGVMRDGGGRVVCAGGEFALAPVYQRRNHGEGEPDARRFARPFNVTCVDGAMLFGRLALMRRLGGFREDFFMYVDSIELSARVLKLGYEIAVVPRAVSYACDAARDGAREAANFHRVKNLFAFYLLHARARVLPEFFVRYGVVRPLRAALSDPRSLRGTLRAWGWLVARAPALLRERRRWASPPRAAL